MAVFGMYRVCTWGHRDHCPDCDKGLVSCLWGNGIDEELELAECECGASWHTNEGFWEGPAIGDYWNR